MSQDPPSVLHLIPTLGAGGAEKQLIYLSGGLVRAGWDVHVGFTARGPNFDLLEATGATIRPIRISGNYDPMLIPRIAQHIRAARPAIVQTWNPMMDIIAGPIARFMGIPWIMSERCAPDFFPDSYKIDLRRWLGWFATGIVANSQAGDDYWATRVKPGTYRAVVRNALPLDQISGAASASLATLGLNSEAKLIFYAGRFEDQKNIEMLISGIALAVTRRADAVAVLCGNGPLREGAAREIRRLGLSERVLLPGFVPDVWSWLKRADVMVSVSHFEGMPNTVMEAMACRCAVVVSDISMHREILDEASGRLVDRHSSEKIAEAIADVLGDPKLAERRSLVAYERAVQWSIEFGTNEYVRIYRQIIEANG